MIVPINESRMHKLFTRPCEEKKKKLFDESHHRIFLPLIFIYFLFFTQDKIFTLIKSKCVYMYEVLSWILEFRLLPTRMVPLYKNFVFVK